MKVEKVGEEIVNSISIHRIQDEEAHLDDIVAVLTNNDKTVRVYSLPQSLETTVLDLPFAMNHATLSPDGQLLVAVGDYNQAYFFQREVTGTTPQIPKPHNRLTSAHVEWTLCSVVSLHATNSTAGYFTTAWSPNGRLVAVGSEGGYVTVLDVDVLLGSESGDEEAVVAVVPSSRPELPNYPGAVRSMLFAPGPWDMLIWAEDQGRVCIGDLRTGLKRKQVVELDPQDDKLRKTAYEDVTAPDGPAVASVSSAAQTIRDIDELEADFLRRYSHAASPLSSGSHSTAVHLIEARRRQRQQRDIAALRAVANTAGVNALEDDPRGLTAREQQILESLRTTRQREEARASGRSGNLNYTSSDMFSNGRSGTATPGQVPDGLSDSFPELSRTSAPIPPRPGSSHGSSPYPLTSIPPRHPLQTPAHWTRDSEASSLIRLSDGSRLPRRRASVILSPSAATANGTASTARPIPSTQASDALPADPDEAEEEDDEEEEREEENPWITIEDHMTLARGPLFERAARANAPSPLPGARPTEAELAAELAIERARARSLARQRDRYRYLRQVPGHGHAAAASFPEAYETLMRRGHLRGIAATHGPLSGVRTAGLAMSADGRTLWVACEEGVFEVGVNVRGRMEWPAVEMR